MLQDPTSRDPRAGEPPPSLRERTTRKKKKRTKSQAKGTPPLRTSYLEPSGRPPKQMFHVKQSHPTPAPPKRTRLPPAAAPDCVRLVPLPHLSIGTSSRGSNASSSPQRAGSTDSRAATQTTNPATPNVFAVETTIFIENDVSRETQMSRGRQRPVLPARTGLQATVWRWRTPGSEHREEPAKREGPRSANEGSTPLPHPQETHESSHRCFT